MKRVTVLGVEMWKSTSVWMRDVSEGTLRFSDSHCTMSLLNSVTQVMLLKSALDVWLMCVHGIWAKVERFDLASIDQRSHFEYGMQGYLQVR